MSWLKDILAIDPKSTRGKLFVLLVDKLLIGAVIAVALFTYDYYRSEREAAREERAAEATLKVERTRLAKDLLPYILDQDIDAVARGYLLSSALSTKLVDQHFALEIASDLVAHGIPARHIHRIASATLPAGLATIARHGARLRVTTSRNTKTEAAENERRIWGAALRQVLSRSSRRQEREIATRRFSARHIADLYFLLEPIEYGEFFPSSSPTLHLIGALACVGQDCQRSGEAAEYIGRELSSMDLTLHEDLTYARALVGLIRQHSLAIKDQNATIAPEMAVHLARMLVSSSFHHRVPWLPTDAPRERRKQWLSEETEAEIHSSLQWASGEILALMGAKAENAEEVLVSFVNAFVRDVEEAPTSKEVDRLRSQYGKYSVRFSIVVLKAIDTSSAQEAIQEVIKIGEEKLGAFEGVRMELNSMNE